MVLHNFEIPELTANQRNEGWRYIWELKYYPKYLKNEDTIYQSMSFNKYNKNYPPTLNAHDHLEGLTDNSTQEEIDKFNKGEAIANRVFAFRILTWQDLPEPPESEATND